MTLERLECEILPLRNALSAQFTVCKLYNTQGSKCAERTLQDTISTEPAGDAAPSCSHIPVIYDHSDRCLSLIIVLHHESHQSSTCALN